MDIGSIIGSIINSEVIYTDIARSVETRFETSNYELQRLLPKGKIKINIGLVNYELGRKLMIEFAALIPEWCSYLIDDADQIKKYKDQKSVS